MDTIWIVIVIIGWIISAVNKANKKQQEAQAKKSPQPARPNPQASQNRAQPAKAPAPNGQWKDGRWVSADQAARTASSQPAAPKPAPARPAPAKVTPVAPTPRQPLQVTDAAEFVSAHSEPLETHMHTPTMGEEGTGTEGIDCCHEYMLDSHEGGDALDFLALAEDAPQERAQALLQGIIYSEILGRHTRRAGGRRV